MSITATEITRWLIRGTADNVQTPCPETTLNKIYNASSLVSHAEIITSNIYNACGINKPWKVTKVTFWGENIITKAFHITTIHFKVMKDKLDGYSHILHINSTDRKYNPCFGNFSRKLTPFTINNSRFSILPYLHISSHTHN